MQIYLSRPGGQKEGPFTVEQIKEGQRRGSFPANEYWAWYEGLPQWVPLYEVPGLEAATEPVPPLAAPLAAKESAGSFETEVQQAPQPAAPVRAESTAATPPAPQLGSGLPLVALERLFVFATGDGQAILQNETTVKILAEITGADMQAQRQSAPRDVISQCKWVADLRRDGLVPENAWKVMTKIRPELVSQARGGKYKICVRTFPSGETDSVALFLFYNKEFMPPAGNPQ